MKKLFMLMWDNGQLKVLPYEEGNALPTVLAEDEENALRVASDIYWYVKRDHYKEDILDRAEDKEIELTDEQIVRAVETMVNRYDCEMTYWDNVDMAIDWAVNY